MEKENREWNIAVFGQMGRKGVKQQNSLNVKQRSHKEEKAMTRQRRVSLKPNYLVVCVLVYDRFQ